MAKPVTRGSNPVAESTEKWDGPKDARTEKGAGKYPYCHTQRTRSGHVITLDDSEDNESITIQHRGGSMVQFMPDGAVQFVSQNGQYTFVFGENRIEVHGAHEITVHGNASMRVDQNFDMTVMGNHNVTVNGDYNLNAKNLNGQIRGDINFNAKSMSAKMEGSTEISSHGITSILSDGGIALKSTSQGVGIKAATDVAIKAAGGQMMLESSGNMSAKPGGKMLIQSGGKTSVKAGGDIGMDASNILLNSDASENAESARLVLPEPQDPAASFGGPK